MRKKKTRKGQNQPEGKKRLVMGKRGKEKATKNREGRSSTARKEGREGGLEKKGGGAAPKRKKG